MPLANLFSSPEQLPEELSEELCRGSGPCRVERIVSRGHASPEGFWYDQSEHEWVTVLEGAALVEFVDGSEVSLFAGDHLWISAHQRHRVSWTTPDSVTIWLAVFFEGAAAPAETG